MITYSEVIEGTRNFHDDLKIGESTFAEVYRGRRGNESFAVKVFKQVLWTTILTTCGIFYLDTQMIHGR